MILESVTGGRLRHGAKPSAEASDAPLPPAGEQATIRPQHAETTA
jgi:cellulose synthase (UDP-forming)